MIIANWKANGNLISNLKWCKFFIENCPKEIISNIGIAPSALHIGQIKELLESSDVKIGIQDIDVKGGQEQALFLVRWLQILVVILHL